MNKIFGISRGVKYTVAVMAVLALSVLTIPTASAGHRWSGMDPAIEINGELMNVWVEWDGHTCDIQGPIETVIVVPRGADYKFLGESGEGFDCDHDGTIDTKLATNTLIVEGKHPTSTMVGSKVNAPDFRFRTGVKIYKNGVLENECRGISNLWLRCNGPDF